MNLDVFPAKPIINDFRLFTNYPNPFNPETKINFQLLIASRVTLKIYDLAGRKIAKLVNGNINAGYHSITFNADKLPSGVYFYKIKAGRFTDTKRMILMNSMDSERHIYGYSPSV